MKSRIKKIKEFAKDPAVDFKTFALYVTKDFMALRKKLVKLTRQEGELKNKYQKYLEHPISYGRNGSVRGSFEEKTAIQKKLAELIRQEKEIHKEYEEILTLMKYKKVKKWQQS